MIELIDRANKVTNALLSKIAGACLLLTVALVVANALVRMIYKPFSGTTEIIGWLSAIAVAFGLGYTQVHRGYVEIDVLVEHLPKKIQSILKMVMLFTSMIFFAFVSWQMVLYGNTIAQNGNLSQTMAIAFYPLIFLVGIGFATLALALFMDFIKLSLGGADNG